MWPQLGGWKRWLTVSGASHLSFTDSPTLLAQLGLQQSGLPADRAVAVTRGYVTAFFDQTLRHIPQAVLNGPTPQNPEVHFNP
ncbi:hypothetical protein [Kutzneria buriramensis]|uniref:1-alkyl-2-acetylglycerophosphocholine esterase n=1 Tax=Kutzneria buriramensis TaxID=1045776 RepID=A0A3E0I020_9PSEU|nr:hypothetical protein [Kutzneria buriramensis]REH52072.1 hypothetical protein BCF44_103521 [Kutzneria buriramensis]